MKINKNFFFLYLILISFLNNSSFGAIPQSSNIVAYYPFSGDATDSSGNGYDGEITGDPQLTTDRFGNSNSAYIFDGDGDWIYFGTETLPTNNGMGIRDAFTISVWAKSSSSTTMDLFAFGGMISCGSGGYGAVVRLASNIQFNSCNRGYNVSTGGKNSDGNWHHYVVTWDGSNTRKIYIDGSVVGTKTLSNVFRIQDYGLVLGRNFMDWTGGNRLNASADELRLWKTDLSASEVQTLYNTENTAPPTLSSSVPADNATSVAVDSTIVLNFSSNVDAESGNITIKKTSDNSTVETINVTSGQVSGSGSSQITITPSSNFSGGETYYVLVDSTAFDDSVSNSYEGISSTTALNFTTVDNTAPTLSSSTPADNATGVAVDANIVLNFDENVDTESGNITIKKTSDNSTVEAIDVTGGQVSGSGGTQITINPSSNLSGSTEYYVLIDASAFDDSAGNSYAGISSTTALSFTTVDSDNPTLSSSTPTDNSEDVSIDSDIVLNFSESVDVETGNITIKKSSDDSTVEQIDVTGSNVSGTGSSEITVSPSNDFEYGTEYYVLIDATAFDDASSNSYAGISSTTALSFTTTSKSNPTKDKVVVGSINAQSELASNDFIQSVSMVSERLDYLRFNRNSNNLSQNNVKIDLGHALLNSAIKAIQASNNSIKNNNPWSIWMDASLSTSRSGASSNSSAKKADTYSLAFGMDKKVNENKLYGYSLQLSQSEALIGTNGSGVNSKNYNFSIYGTFPRNNNNFIEGLIGVGTIRSDITRRGSTNTFESNREGDQYFASLNYGKVLEKGNLNLIPTAQIDIGYTELDAYSEDGTDALNYEKQTIENGFASIGLGFNNFINYRNSTFKPFGSIRYGLDFSSSTDAKMNYVSDPNTTYTFTGNVQSEEIYIYNFGFNHENSNGVNITFGFERREGDQNEQTNKFNFGAQLNQDNTGYTMNINEELVAGINFTKEFDLLDLKLDLNHSILNTNDRNIFAGLSKNF